MLLSLWSIFGKIFGSSPVVTQLAQLTEYVQIDVTPQVSVIDINPLVRAIDAEPQVASIDITPSIREVF